MILLIPVYAYQLTLSLPFETTQRYFNIFQGQFYTEITVATSLNIVEESKKIIMFFWTK